MVEAAKIEIDQLREDVFVSVDIRVNKNEAGKIIGKGGETIKRIQNSTHAWVKVEDLSDSHKIVRISGKNQMVEAAKAEIEELRKYVTLDLTLENDDVGKV